MTVFELIRKLSEYPADSPVVIDSDGICIDYILLGSENVAINKHGSVMWWRDFQPDSNLKKKLAVVIKA